jgi:hypothetical protein
MSLLLAGVASYSIADSAFSYLTAQGAFGSVGNVIDTGWFAGFLLIALAAVYPETSPKTVAKGAPLDLWQLALPWMTLLLASAGDLYSALSTNGLDVFQTSLTFALAVLLTLNMIIERREFLDMLVDIDTSHLRLREDFKASLIGIKRFSAHMRDEEQLDLDDVRRVAADIHRDAERLDGILEELLDGDEGGPNETGARPLGTAEGEVVAAGSR